MNTARNLMSYFLVTLSVFSAEAIQAATLQPIPGNNTASGIANELGNLTAAPSGIIANPHQVSTPSTPPQSSPPTRAGNGSFVLRDVLLNIGNSRAPVPVCATQLIKSVTNKLIDLRTIPVLANQLKNCYHQAGYILNGVGIPSQNISRKVGKVIFNVVDGHIKRVDLVGDSPKGATKQLQRYLNKIQSMKPFNVKEAERYLLLANDIPGITLKGQLKLDPQYPTTAVYQVQVQRQAYSGVINANNRGSEEVGPVQTLAQVTFYDLWAADNFQLTAAKTVPLLYELSYLSASYGLQIGEEGTQLTASEIHTHTKPGASSRSLKLDGNYNQFEISIAQPIIRSLGQNLSLLGNLYHSDNTSSQPSRSFFNDKITALQGGLSYELMALGGDNKAQGLITHGFPLNGDHSNFPSRTNATQDFNHFNVTASHFRYLTERVSALLVATGQYSHNALPVSEQLSFGGDLYGLAYQPSELTGDKGYIGSASLRYDLTPFSVFKKVQPFVTYDNGKLWNNSPGTSESRSTSGSSLAIGVNGMIKNDLLATLTLAKPMTTAPSNDSSKAWVGFFNISLLF